MGKVRVWVDKSGLTKLRYSSHVGDREAVEERRGELESIASANYDLGNIEPDGSTIIRRDDVEALD